MSFPGGRIDPYDASPEAAALRETREELGIPERAVRVLGRLDEMYTLTGYHIVPVVGVLTEDVELRPNEVEVARAFAVPLADLLLPERWEQRAHSYHGSVADVWHFAHDGEDIWGVTGAILRGFIELLWRFPMR